MPASLPSSVTSAPPEFPGFIAASVWIKNRNSHGRSCKCRNNPAGDSLTDTKWITDCQHKVSDFKFIGIAKLKDRQLFSAGINAQNSQVGTLIGKYQGCFELASIRERDLYLIASFYDVMIGNDNPF